MAGELPVTNKTTAQLLIDQFLLWTKENRAEATYDWYLQHLQSFADFIGPKLLVHDVKANHVSRWLARSYRDCRSNHKNGACRSVARAFNWAVKQRLIASSPVRGMERPAYQPSEACLTADQWRELIGLIKPKDALLDIIWFMHVHARNRLSAPRSPDCRSQGLRQGQPPVCHAAHGFQG